MASDDAAAEDAGEPNAPAAPAEDPQDAADDDAQPAAASLSQADIDAALGGATDAAEPNADASESPPKLDTAGRPFDEAAAAMEAAIAEEQAAAKAQPAAEPPPEPRQPPPPPENAVSLDLPDFGPDTTDETDAAPDQSIDLLHNVDLNVKIELGRVKMYIEEVLKLGEGSVVELDKLAGDPVDVLVNERLVARGEVLVLNDNFCVRISEIVAGLALPAEAEAAAS
jgi:flagellar motor switch protein FliN/FliY